MRVIRDLVGDVIKDGQTIHSNVRVQKDDSDRVAVFLSRKAPDFVYAPNEVTYTISRRPCACKNDAPRATLARLWETADRQAANAG